MKDYQNRGGGKKIGSFQLIKCLWIALHSLNYANMIQEDISLKGLRDSHALLCLFYICSTWTIVTLKLFYKIKRLSVFKSKLKRLLCHEAWDHWLQLRQNQREFIRWDSIWSANSLIQLSAHKLIPFLVALIGQYSNSFC